MTTEFKDFNDLMQQLNSVLTHIRSCAEAPDLEQWSSRGFKACIDTLENIEANIEANIKMIEGVGCVCPVCAIAKEHLRRHKDNVFHLRMRMTKYQSSAQNPLETMLLLGTTTTMLVSVPDLIDIMSDLAQQAHDMGRVILEGKIVEMSAGERPNNPKDVEPERKPN
jgi:hydrogenase maturation factor